MDTIPLPNEISDNWEAVEEMEAEVDAYYFLKRLNPKQRQIAELLGAGYNQVEIGQKLGVSKQAISQAIKKIKRFTT